MHKGIMIENSLILEKKETYFLLKCPPYLLKKNPLDLKLKCGTLDGFKAHLCSLIMLLPGMPRNLLCKEELLPNLTIHGYLSYRLH